MLWQRSVLRPRRQAEREAARRPSCQRRWPAALALAALAALVLSRGPRSPAATDGAGVSGQAAVSAAAVSGATVSVAAAAVSGAAVSAWQPWCCCPCATSGGGGTAVAAMIDLEDLEEAELEDAEEVAAMLLAAPLRVEDREAAGESGTARALPPPSHPPTPVAERGPMGPCPC